jgi:hypothetical protein
MDGNTKRQPIFIVGAPRSGTTLLAAMLAAHSRLSCGPETHFFRFLSQTDASRLCEPRSWPDDAVKFLFSYTVLRKPVPEHYGISEEQIYSYLREQPPTVSAILSAITELHMIETGKCRWVEKTPNHMAHVYGIRRYFPKSPIIRILRDPRDVALSIMKAPWEWAPRSFLEALMFWRDYDDQSASFFESDDNCYSLYYEGLVNSPESELRQLCSFIGEEYEHDMLVTSKSVRNVVTDKDLSWHGNVSAPVDKTRIHVWKTEITQEQNRLAEALIGGRLKTYGYESSEQFQRTASTYPSLGELLKRPEVFRSLVEAGIRFWCESNEEKCNVIIFIGEPASIWSFGNKKLERSAVTCRVVAQILKEKLSNKDIYWVRDRDVSTKLGRSGRMLTLVLKLTGDIYLA